jgi:hypothetical protein
MPYAVLADLVLVVHLAFVVFVALGGLLALRWPAVVVAHLPAAAWGAFIELTGRICPLTPLENSLRGAAGETRYAGDFVGRYVFPVVYPEGISRDIQLVLGALVIVVNVAIYGIVWQMRRARSAVR